MIQSWSYFVQLNTITVVDNDREMTIERISAQETVIHSIYTDPN